MISSLLSATSGMLRFQERMDVIGNNIANVGTTAFKTGRADFAESFNQTLTGATATTSGGTTSSLQVGTGVSTSNVRDVFTQGVLSQTDAPLDMAIDGKGFFVVRDTLSDGNLLTRAGNFTRDSDGFLSTATGQRVQGFDNPGLSQIGDLQIDATGKPASAAANAVFQSFSVGEDGKIVVRLTDNTEFVRGQLLLQNVANPQALTKEGNNLLSGIEQAGPLGGALSPTPTAPGSGGSGIIRTGYLEGSNVDLITQFSDLIIAQRAFQASARMVTTSDQVMQEIVNLVR